jgi:heat shock protein HslJ
MISLRNALQWLSLTLIATAGIGTTVIAQEEQTLYVGPHKAICTGVGPQWCMLTRQDAAADWTYFYNQIEGFAYEWGTAYELRVAVTEVENPPADASSLRYELVEIISEQPAAEATFTLMADTAFIQREGDTYTVLGEVRFTTPTQLIPADYGGPLAITLAYAAAGESEFGFVSVGVPAPAPTPALEGTFWLGTALNGQPVPASVQVSLFLADGNASGKSGCNNFNVGYTIDGANLAFGMGMSTLMACPEPAMSAEQAFNAALPTVVSYAIAGDTLVLLDAEGNAVMEFAAFQLAGSSWDLIMLNNASLPEGTSATIAFDGEMATGLAGCNNFRAAYTLDGTDLSVGMAMTTRKMCPEPQMELEREFLAALEAVVAYQVHGDTLSLLDNEGRMRLTFASQNWLASTAWDLIAAAGFELPAEGEGNIRFNDATDVSGKAYCNSFGGEYVLRGESLRFPFLAVTSMACDEPLWQGQLDFMGALENVATASINADGQLVLGDASGAALLVFAPQAAN